MDRGYWPGELGGYSTGVVIQGRSVVVRAIWTEDIGVESLVARVL
jgi:hypothetical protein